MLAAFVYRAAPPAQRGRGTPLASRCATKTLFSPLRFEPYLYFRVIFLFFLPSALASFLSGRPCFPRGKFWIACLSARIFSFLSGVGSCAGGVRLATGEFAELWWGNQTRLSGYVGRREGENDFFRRGQQLDAFRVHQESSVLVRFV